MRVLASRQRGAVGLDLLFDPADCWIGLYWCTRWDVWCDAHGLFGDRRYLWVYVCLVPMLPVRVRVPLMLCLRGWRRG